MRRFVKTMGVAAAVALPVVLIGVSSAFASSSVWWGLTSGSWPANLPQGGTGKVVVTAQNRGYGDAYGSETPFVLKDTLPAGLEVIISKGNAEVEGVAGEHPGTANNRGPVPCLAPSAHEVECEFDGMLPPGEQLEVRIAVRVSGEATASEENSVSVFGGNAAEATFARAISVGEETSFGVEDYELLPEEEGGQPTTQAGAHPFQLTTVLGLNSSEAAPSPDEQNPAALAKDLTFQLPPGLIGNPTPFAQCTDAQFAPKVNPSGGLSYNECSPQTAIGLATITFNENRGTPFTTTTVPLFNLVPLVGEPARFGFEIAGLPTILNTAVRTGGDYGVTVHVNNIIQSVGFMVSKVTFWGVPGDPRHNSSRGWACLEGQSSCAASTEAEPPPLLSMPTACSGTMSSTVQADSWSEPMPARPLQAPLFREDTIGGLDGCNRLPFEPEISVAPDVPDASTPTGLEVKIHVPQTAALNPEGLAESALRNTTVTLPAGVAVNPGGADGLEACSEGQVGFTGYTEFNPRFEPGVSTATFTPVVGDPFCANGSKVATVEIETPLLPHALKGAVYLAAQTENPFGSLVAMYLIVEDPVSGTLLKIAGDVALDPHTGQIVTTFTNTPELPFENLRLHFFGEARAPLGTPARCGAYTTGASFVPWSGNAASNVSSTFDITSGPDGSSCPGASLPFDPSLTVGTTNIQAGAFSPFTMTVSREDGQQSIQRIELHLPAGLSGLLSGVELCSEAAADAGTCGPNSLIGETTVSVGLGDSPYAVSGGRVYITGPYHGAPFGVSVVVPAKAGPYNLGTVVVRGKIEVNPITAELTFTTNSPDEGYAIPTILDGIPLQIKHVNFTTTRPGFTFNPTSCEPMAITGSVDGTEGASSALSEPFQVTNCATLAFKPGFQASTSGKTSRADGASLSVKLTYPKTSFGSQANIKSVKVDLPKQLPSRLTTLQKACTATQFNGDPAGCPSASIVGHAKAVTPLIPVPLEGPAYFVSYGGAKFPELVIVLQGYGVTLDLHGETFISKAGITSSTFHTIPDAPVGSFELTLPEGPYSALAANGSLCATTKTVLVKKKMTVEIKGRKRTVTRDVKTTTPQMLVMPTVFTAQNGAEIKQNTPITTTGCPKKKTTPTKKTKKAKTSGHHQHG